MAFSHPLLAPALSWKHNDLPGMSTAGGELIGWPMEPWPTDTQLSQWVSEYLTYLTSPQAKDDELQKFLDSTGGKAIKTIALIGIDKGLWTLADLRTKYRSL